MESALVCVQVQLGSTKSGNGFESEVVEERVQGKDGEGGLFKVCPCKKGIQHLLHLQWKDKEVQARLLSRSVCKGRMEKGSSSHFALTKREFNACFTCVSQVR